MATKQLGFYAKRVDDVNPIFVSLPDGETDIEKWKNEWRSRSNTQWVGDDPSTMNTDIATGNTAKYSPAVNDPLEEDYFANVLRQVEEEFASQRTYAQKSYNTLVDQMKEGRELYNKDLEKTYGQALETANVNVYARGAEQSGIQGRQFGKLTEDKVYQTEQRDLLEKQKQQIADQDLKQRLESIARSEERSKFSVNNPYAGYSYT